MAESRGRVQPTVADALVLLSNAEGLPQVLIQAAPPGLPFVSYDVDGGREVVALSAAGEIVRSWDPAVIAVSYRSVVDDTLQENRRAT